MDTSQHKPPIDLDTNTAKIVSWGYKHSSMVILIICCLVALGIYALEAMNKNQFPKFTIREGLVAVAYPGASPEKLENEVVKELNSWLFSYKEINKAKTHTRATQGMVVAYVTLNDDIEDTDQFWNELQLGSQAFKLKLPPGAIATEVISNFGDTSSLLITMSSTDKTYRELGDLMDRLEADVRGVESVGAMSVMGKQTEQIAVYLDPERLSRYAVGEKEIAMVLAAQGLATTSGEIKGAGYTTPIAVAPGASSIKNIQDQVLMALPEGGVLRLGDVARVVRQYPDATSYVTNNGEKCLVLSVSVKDGHNVVEMGRQVEKKIEEFEQITPADVKLFRITNEPLDVHNSVIYFLTELLIAVVAVVVAIMLLLPWRVALIAASTIPISIFISLGVFFALGIELNTVTLACLIVSLGMIVDNSVIILDEYVDLVSKGVDRKTATLSSSSSYFKAIISATLAISVTFFPFLLTMKGMFHDFLLDFPWAISIILFISLIVAELLVPVLQYSLIKDPKVAAEQQQKKGVKRHFTLLGAVQKGYDHLIDLCFRWPKTVLLLGVALVAWSVYLLMHHPMKLMPIKECNQFAVEVYLPTGSPVQRTDVVADSLARLIKADPRVVSVAVFHGCSSPRFQATFAPKIGAPNYAQFIVNTKSNAATVEVLNELAPKYETYFPDAVVSFVQLNYSQAEYPIDVRVSGHDRQAIAQVADTIRDIMMRTPGLKLVRTSLTEPQDIALLDVDGTRLQRLGGNLTDLQLSLAMRYGAGIPVTTVWEGDYGMDVVLKTSQSDTSSVAALRRSPVPLITGQSVPLSQIATVKPQATPGRLCERNGVPTVSVYCDVRRGLNAMDMTAKVQHAIKDLPLPPGVSISYGGDYDETETILPELGSALLMAVVIIFFILLFHYKDVRVSLLLVGCLALCVPGAALGLIIGDMPMSLTCTLGMISLMGILVRNAIIMIDYAELLQRKEGLDPRSASLASAKRRMRPIMLTSTAASMGVVPMVLSDSGLWQPMGAVILWGTLLTMVFILTFIPIAYWKTSPKPKKNASTLPVPA